MRAGSETLSSQDLSSGGGQIRHEGSENRIKEALGRKDVWTKYEKAELSARKPDFQGLTLFASGCYSRRVPFGRGFA
jgi:hypothetical protein